MRKQIFLSNGIIMEFDVEMTLEEFNNGFLHLTADERNEAWTLTHPTDEPASIPEGNKATKSRTATNP